ncbi:TMV resistance protein N-like [Pyrus ussuriensis x Pyrus communis]|uniref:TMV resistance protein N-like n=1 Tax=Pyrus ussuriensis x Pyrus communis TaxID=2448454 RepID=A0A5N5I0W7_9ROSA|nr:TMV resistance protein N-like [Pyrus ussuriensis x Pyrus communis]
MVPKIVARTQSSYKTGEGIATMCCLFNGLHRPQADLQTLLFFEEEGVLITVENVEDTLVLKEAAAEATRQKTGSSHAAGYVEDLFELFGDFEGEAEPVLETRAPRRTRASVVETSESEPEEQPRAQLSIPGPRATPTKKMTRAQASRTSKSSKPSITPSATKKPTFISPDEPLGAKMHQKARELLSSTLEELEFSPFFLMCFCINFLPNCLKYAIREENISPSKVSSLSARAAHASPPQAKQPEKKTKASVPLVRQSSTSIPSTSPPLVVVPTSQFNPTTEEMMHFVEDNTHESHLPTTSVFGEPIVLEIPVVSGVTSPQASPQPTTTTEELYFSTQDPARQISTSTQNRTSPTSSGFGVIGIPIPRPKKKTKTTVIPSPQASPSVETASTIAHFEGAGTLPFSLAPIFSTTSLPKLFKEALRDQHQRAKRQQLVDEGSATEERIKVMTSEMQKLEEYLAVLKAEQTILLSKLRQQIEEVKKANLEMEDVESQLVNSSTVLAKPSRIFIIMQTYHSRIITLGEDVNLLG